MRISQNQLNNFTSQRESREQKQVEDEQEFRKALTESGLSDEAVGNILKYYEDLEC